MLKYFFKGADSFEIADAMVTEDGQPPLLYGIPFIKRQGSMSGISECFIHTAGLTDVNICIAAERIDHQVRRQWDPTPKAFGRLVSIAIRIEFFVDLPDLFNQILGIKLIFIFAFPPCRFFLF